MNASGRDLGGQGPEQKKPDQDRKMRALVHYPGQGEHDNGGGRGVAIEES